MTLADAPIENKNIEKKYITLYGKGCTYESFNNAVQKYFSVYDIKYDNDWIKFKINNVPVSINTNKSKDNNYFRLQATGMRNFFASSKMPNSSLKDSILQTIYNFDCIFGFMIEENKDDNTTINFVAHIAFQIAKELNLFVLYPNMNLYTPDRKLFISFTTGNSAWYDKSAASSKPILRKEKSIKLLHSQGITYLAQLPTIDDSSQVTLKSLEDICKRAVASLLSIQVACDINNGNYEKSKTFFENLLEKYNVKQHLNSKEKKLFDGTYDVIDIDWEYETYWSLVWALGLVDDISDATKICDCSLAIKLVNENNTYEDFLAKCKLRDIEEILDMLDLYYRYHWAIVEKSLNPETNIAKLT